MTIIIIILKMNRILINWDVVVRHLVAEIYVRKSDKILLIVGHKT